MEKAYLKNNLHILSFCCKAENEVRPKDRRRTERRYIRWGGQRKGI